MTYEFAERVSKIRSSAIRDMLKITEMPEVISLAGGLPAEELFPTSDIKAAVNYVLQAESAASLQYGPTEGYLPLRKQIASIMNERGVYCSADEILVTNGSQQSLDLLGRVFLNQGDVVLMENPTYLAAIQAFEAFEPRLAAVPTDEQGMLPEALEKAIIEKQPKLVYLVPTFQNPTGRTMNLERRSAVARILRQHQVLLVEDDPYSALRFEGDELPSIKSMENDWVIYLSTFSKTVAPGFRVGWMVGDRRVISNVAKCKQGADLHTNSLVQHILVRYLQEADTPAHIDRIRAEYKRRKDAMLEALAREFPPEVSWSLPEGGMFLWLQLPEGLDTELLLTEAVAQKVAFVPGKPFFVGGGGENTMRLNYSNSSPGLINEAIRRLARLIRPHLDVA
ncbi:MAG: PLP-dependent aminotransferase family protein [Deltaproteobacteria bacterium]